MNVLENYYRLKALSGGYEEEDEEVEPSDDDFDPPDDDFQPQDDDCDYHKYVMRYH